MEFEIHDHPQMGEDESFASDGETGSPQRDRRRPARRAPPPTATPDQAVCIPEEDVAGQ
jgi:hypothetical protein